MANRKLLTCVLAGLLLLASDTSLPAAQLNLEYSALTSTIDKLSDSDRMTVYDAIALIKKGNNGQALARLNALNDRQPDNSAIRILTAYALLQVGNLLGAFENAQAAEKTPGGNAYACWFLAKVALLSGRNEVCRREMSHLEKGGAPAAQIRELRAELTAKEKGKPKN